MVSSRLLVSPRGAVDEARREASPGRRGTAGREGLPSSLVQAFDLDLDPQGRVSASGRRSFGAGNSFVRFTPDGRLRRAAG